MAFTATRVEPASGADDVILTTPELADRWHTSVAAIHTLRSRGLAPRGFRVGRRVLWRLADVREFEQSKAS